MASRTNRKKKLTKPANQRPNKLREYLEDGQDPTGLTGYVATSLNGNRYTYEDDEYPVIIKVRLKRIDASGCGVTVYAEPFSGSGEFKVTPCQWFDSPKELEADRELKARIDQAENVYRKSFGNHYVTKVKRCIVECLQSSRPEVLHEFTEEIRDRFNHGPDATLELMISKAPIESIKPLFKQALLDEYRLNDHSNDVSFR